MKYFIAHDSAPDRFGAERFLLCLGDFLYDFEIFSYVLYIPDPTVMFLRDHLRMSRRLGIDVKKSEEFVIFVHFVRWDFSLHDFAKNTVFHVWYYTKVKKYSLRDQIPEDVSESLKIYPELMRTLLAGRGIDTAEKAEKFLNPDYTTLHDPFLLKDMDRAVERIFRAVRDNENILIYSDYDADGIPAAVVMSDFFKLIGYKNVEVYIPHRHNEGYGLHLEAIDSFKGKHSLIITLDCGIVDVDEVKRAEVHGIDVIITDHHLPGEKLPLAYAVINPKRSDCSYPYDMLCGAGVAFKLVQALLETLREQTEEEVGEKVSRRSEGDERERPASTPERVPSNLLPLPDAIRSTIRDGQEKWLLDMVGMATLSDMVPLLDENRTFAHYGLKVIRKSRRPGLMHLLRKIKVNQAHITEDDIGFMVTPRINAASRMGVPSDAYKLLSTDDEAEAGRLADHLDHINNERKGLVAAMVKEIKKTLEERKDHFENKKIIVLGNPNWRPAILGLAANTIVEEHGKPVFLWGKEDGKEIKGSCRSDGVVNVVKLMEAKRESFIEFGGHKFSGGFAVHHEKIHTLEDELVAAVDALGPAVIEEEQNRIDAKLELHDVNWKTYDIIEKLSPFGVGNPKPLFLFEKVRLEGVKMFGKATEHLELSFMNSNNKSIKAIGFFMKPEDFSVNLKPGNTIDLIATLEKSMFRNFPELRLRIVDVI